MSGGRTQTLKPMKHPKLNGGQRPVGLDQDRAQAPKVNGDSLVKKRSRHMDAMTRIRSSTGGNVPWKNSDSETNEASEAQRGATSGGVGQGQLHFQKQSEAFEAQRGGNVRWGWTKTVAFPKKNLKHSKLSGGKRPVGLDQYVRWGWTKTELRLQRSTETV